MIKENGVWKGQGQILKDKMVQEGKVKTLTFKQSNSLDDKLEEGFAPIQNESRRRQLASRAYQSDLESGRINLYNRPSLYQRIKNYFSNSFYHLNFLRK